MEASEGVGSKAGADHDQDVHLQRPPRISTAAFPDSLRAALSRTV